MGTETQNQLQRLHPATCRPWPKGTQSRHRGFCETNGTRFPSKRAQSTKLKVPKMNAKDAQFSSIFIGNQWSTQIVSFFNCRPLLCKQNVVKPVKPSSNQHADRTCAKTKSKEMYATYAGWIWLLLYPAVQKRRDAIFWWFFCVFFPCFSHGFSHDFSRLSPQPEDPSHALWSL